MEERRYEAEWQALATHMRNVGDGVNERFDECDGAEEDVVESEGLRSRRMFTGESPRREECCSPGTTILHDWGRIEQVITAPHSLDER